MSWGTRARTWTLLLQRQACCLVTPFPIKWAKLCAARDLNPQDLRIKNPLLYQLS
jgi:hypothetical protein